MKNARWLTPLAGIVLFGSAIFHSLGYIPLLHKLNASPVKNPLEGFIKAMWWVFSVEMIALGAIVFLAHRLEHGSRIVLLCAATTGISAVLLFRFMGAFPGVYLLAIVTVVLFLGAGRQSQEKPSL